jgi:mycothiol synthase
MNLHRRPLSNDVDKFKMLCLSNEYSSENLHVIDLPYRLSSWSLDDTGNACLWFDMDENLIGWAVLQTPFWTIDYAYRPSMEGLLHREMLSWADGRARSIADTRFGHPAWYVMVFEDHLQRIRDLEDAGFECLAYTGEDSWSKVLMRRSLETSVKLYQPPAGYTIRSLKGEEEAEAYVELHRSVFESRNMTVDWRLRTLEHPAYHRDLDIVVEAPGGKLAAFCICWIDMELSAGHVEPLGCHKDFRKYALGRVALSHGLHRLQSMGAKEIFVETDSFRNTAFRLYEFFDFQVIKNVRVYRKNYEA